MFVTPLFAMPELIRVVSRSSRLALVQAELAQGFLEPFMANTRWFIDARSTVADKNEEISLQEAGGQGLFTKELELALLSHEATIAVHSAKDMPTAVPDGLVIAGYLPREAVHDVLVVRKGVEEPFFHATGSPRRRYQAQKIFSDVQWVEIRGNVPTRLRKIFDGYAHASFLAAAGLNRLGLDKYTGLVFRSIPISQMVPAAGQGAIAIQCRVGDEERFRPFLHKATYRSVTVERMVLSLLGAGCQTPVGVYLDDNLLHFFHPDVGYKAIELKGVPFTIAGQEANILPLVKSALKQNAIPVK